MSARSKSAPKKCKELPVGKSEDPLNCSCAYCRKFWRDHFPSSSDVLLQPVLSRAQNTSTLFRKEQDEWRLRIGDRVRVKDQYNGVVKFVGVLDENLISPEVYVGVRLDENIGSTHNGIFNGKRYFYCSRGHGCLVSYCDVMPILPPEKTPPIRGNYMFKSYGDVVKTRTQRRIQSMAEMENTPQKSEKKPVQTVYDKDDIAYKDAVRTGGKVQVYSYANTKFSIRAVSSNKPKIDPQQRRYNRLREEFGGGERGDTMVKTLKKLQEGLEEGRRMVENQEGLDEGLSSPRDEDEEDEELMRIATTTPSRATRVDGDVDGLDDGGKEQRG